MGYSITTPVLTKSNEKQMLEFLGKEFRHYDEIIGKPLEDRYISDPLSEHFENKSIGFEYNSGWGTFDTFEREYYHVILKWIALQVGKTRSRFTEEFKGVKGPCVYTTYDECEFWPVLTEKPDNDKHLWRWVDGYGMKKHKDSIFEQHSFIAMELGTVPDPKWKPDKKGFSMTSPNMWGDKVMEFIKSPYAEKKYTQKMVDDPRTLRKILTRDLFGDAVKERLAPIKAEIIRLDKAWTKQQ